MYKLYYQVGIKNMKNTYFINLYFNNYILEIADIIEQHKVFNIIDKNYYTKLKKYIIDN